MAIRTLTDFIQADVITGLLIDKLNEKMVAKNIVTVTAQATLGMGSSYKIPGVGTLTSTSYAVGTPLTSQAATQTKAVINLDKNEIVQYILENTDVTEANAYSLVVAWADEAATVIGRVIDKGIFTDLFTNGTAVAGTLGATTAPINVNTGVEALAYIASFAKELKKAKVLDDGYIVIPTWMGVYLATELKGTYNPDIAARAILEGVTNRLYGYDIYESDNMPADVAGGLVADEFGVIGGKRSCAALVLGRTGAASGESETADGMWHRSTQVFGTKVINEDGILKGVIADA